MRTEVRMVADTLDDALSLMRDGYEIWVRGDEYAVQPRIRLRHRDGIGPNIGLDTHILRSLKYMLILTQRMEYTGDGAGSGEPYHEWETVYSMCPEVERSYRVVLRVWRDGRIEELPFFDVHAALGHAFETVETRTGWPTAVIVDGTPILVKHPPHSPPLDGKPEHGLWAWVPPLPVDGEVYSALSTWEVLVSGAEAERQRGERA